MSNLPSLSGESEIYPHFANRVENLSDSEDEKDDSDNEDDSKKKQNVENTKQLKKTVWHYDAAEEISPSKELKKEDDNVKRKKRKIDNGELSTTIISSAAQKMMKAMGYKEGKGLGKHGQGRIAPVEASKQKGRKGLGVVFQEIDRSLIRYDPSKEKTDVLEDVYWLDGGDEIDYTSRELSSWIVIGPKKRILDDETHFCNPDILKNVLTCKTAFDKVPSEEMRRATGRSNPYELIKKGPFLNRAAMKMANMDFVFDQMFTNPVDEYGAPMVAEKELLYFADVCAGPGGFSEYVLSRKKWKAKGFGFTLKKENDFKLADFYAGPCESFEPFYGRCEDGDIYKSDNISSLYEHVMRQTDEQGVHFMMADGGFSVEGQENIQEILSKRLYLCQFLVALLLVRSNGHFVCKIFDIFTPFSVGLIYLMYRCFKKISIHKPNTSRPANSERYIICKWKYDNVNEVREYLFDVNVEFDKYGTLNDQDINEIVPLDVLKNDERFYNYIVMSNNTLGERQVNCLAKILLYTEDESLVEMKQTQLKKECMERWNVEIGARKGPPSMDAEALARRILKSDTGYLRNIPTNVTKFEKFQKFMHSVYDWHAVILGENGKNATFYLGVSHKKCYKFDQLSKRWTQISSEYHSVLEFSPQTLVFGEIVPEVIGESRSQRKINTFHIIDGHTLGGVFIGDLHYTERVKYCSLYAKALNRPSMISVMPIRMKSVCELEEFEGKFLEQLRIIIWKNNQERPAMPVISTDIESCDQFYNPKGIMFLKATKSPFLKCYSQTNSMKYYWAPKINSTFELPIEACNNFKCTYEESLTWFVNEEENVPFMKQKFIESLTLFIEEKTFKKNDK